MRCELLSYAEIAKQTVCRIHGNEGKKFLTIGVILFIITEYLILHDPLR
jgi:hypothetical protein